jgi:hypothetical protein
MKYASGLSAASAVLLLGLFAPAQAAPAGGMAGSLKAVADESSGVEQVRHRCYWRHGYWHCPRHRYYPYSYAPGIYFESGRRHHHYRYNRRW